MLQKTTNAVSEWGFLGRVCDVWSPPIIPAPPPPQVPKPPKPGLPPAAPPPAGYSRVSTYTDENGDCWRVIQWIGVAATIYEAAFGSITQYPIECEDP